MQAVIYTYYFVFLLTFRDKTDDYLVLKRDNLSCKFKNTYYFCPD